MNDVTAERPMDHERVVRERPNQDFVDRLGIAARDNPAAAALIAMGAVWLFAGGSKVSILGSRDSRRTGRTKSLTSSPASAVVGLYAEGVSAAAEDAARGTKQATRHATEKASDLAEHAATIGEDAADAAVDAVGTVAQVLSSAASRTGSAVAEAGMSTSRVIRGTASAAWHEAEDIGHSVREMLEDRPLAIAALGLAAGAGLALALPRTETERNLFGERSKALREQARTLASQGIDDAREGGEAELAQSMRDARANGITEDIVKSAVEEFASKLGKVASATREAAENEVNAATDKV